MTCMRKTLSTWVLVAGLIVSTNAFATASFANRSIGLGVSGFTILGDSTAVGIDWGVPITLEGGLYLESGFELFLRIPLLFAQQKFGVTANNGPGIVIGSGGQFGVRYLFLEESIRPWVSLGLSGLYFVRDGMATGLNNFFIGPGIGAGCDFFVAESVSLGARGYFDLYVTLNRPLSMALGGGAYVSVYF
jgi:outer membrane protein